VVTPNGSSRKKKKKETDVRRRIWVGVNVWAKVEGVIADRKISRKLKRKVLVTFVISTPFHWNSRLEESTIGSDV